MLAIRLQRTGRSNHAQFRLIVQDSRFSPKSGRVVAFLGSYDPHTKTVICDNEKATKYLTNGAQPSPRAAAILAKEGVKLPSWVKQYNKTEGAIRNPEKLRRNRPAEPEAPADEAPAASEPAEPTEAPTEEKSTEVAPVDETPEVAESTAEETPEPVAEEAPAEDVEKA